MQEKQPDLLIGCRKPAWAAVDKAGLRHASSPDGGREPFGTQDRGPREKLGQAVLGDKQPGIGTVCLSGQLCQGSGCGQKAWCTRQRVPWARTAVTSSSVGRGGVGGAARGLEAIDTKHWTVKGTEPPVVQRERGTDPESHSGPGRTGPDPGVLMPLPETICVP